MDFPKVTYYKIHTLMCNECRSTCVVVLMVMLTGYLPEMRKQAFYKADQDDLHR